jgi:Protein kinase domain/HEAT repeats/Putative zinc-finger
MMACPDHDQFQRLVEGRLDGEERRILQAHLDGCTACEQALVELVRTAATLIPGHTQVSVEALPGAQPAATAVPMAQLGVGARVDHFEVLERLGRGGMGAVYLARDTKLGRNVALKVIATEHHLDDRAIERFQTEARAMAQFSHPNIVSIYEVGDWGGAPYVAMEYVEGQTLRRRMRSPLSLPEVLAIAREVADALAEAHRQGVVHRDLKPENVILGGDGRARVLDFGLAAFLDTAGEDLDPALPPASKVAVTGAAGTPRYMAPEQWRGTPVDGRTDVWALGVMLYEMVARRAPFEAATLEALLEIELAETPAPRLTASSDVAPPVDDLVARCLDRDQASRPSAEQVCVALVALAEPVPRVRRRGPALALGAVLAAAALFVGGRSLSTSPPTAAPTSTAAAASTAMLPSPVTPAVAPAAGAGRCEVDLDALAMLTPQAVAPDPNLEEAAEALVASMKAGRIGMAGLAGPSAGPAAVQVVATHDDPTTLAAALDVMDRIYRAESKGGDLLGVALVSADEGYHQAVARHLQSDDGRVLAGAIRAARHSIEGPTPRAGMVGTLLRHACAEDPARRVAALDSLATLRNPRPEVELAVFVAALHSTEVFLVAETLRLLRRAARNYRNREPLLNEATRLSTHAEPVVRGLALSLLGELGRMEHERRPELMLVVRPHLADPSAHVRGKAMLALGEFAQAETVSALMAVVDSDENTKAVVTYTDLSGKRQRLTPYVAAYDSLGLAAVKGIAKMSWLAKPWFIMPSLGGMTRDAYVAKTRGMAKAWWARAEGQLAQ